MLQVEKEEIIRFIKDKFPDKAYTIGRGWWNVQAGSHWDDYVHFEYINDHVELHIEGPDWRRLRDYLCANVRDSRVEPKHWWRNNCSWMLKEEPTSWSDLQEAFITLANIMNPHILKFERSLGQKMVKPGDSPLKADFKSINDCLKQPMAIPEYQRPYRWGIKNVEQLLTDIQTSMSNGKITYLIGTIILNDNSETLNIVDGQQRITTISLLLKALGERNLPELKFGHSDLAGFWLTASVA